MSEENKAIIRSFYEAIATGDVETWERLVADDFVAHIGGFEEPVDREGHKQLDGKFRAAFPNISFSFPDQMASGELVASRMNSTGTHLGDFQSIPPSGKSVTITGLSIDGIVDGKIAERWVEFDQTAIT